jgi:putative tryptophan/tyrosine transport system substrate-binding protein
LVSKPNDVAFWHKADVRRLMLLCRTTPTDVCQGAIVKARGVDETAPVYHACRKRSASQPFAARAQQAEKMRRIGILMLFAQTDQQAHADYAAFTTELQRVGWTEGQNIRIDQRWANGDVSRLQVLATELVDLKPDLVVVQGSAALAALQHATRTLPIIFAEVTDPVGQGFVESLARPGGNTTGFALFELSMGEKWLDLLKKLSPSTKQVAILSNPVTSTAPFAKLYFQSINAAAPRFGIKSFSLEVDDKADLERMLSDLARDPSNGLIVLLDAFTYANREVICQSLSTSKLYQSCALPD